MAWPKLCDVSADGYGCTAHMEVAHGNQPCGWTAVLMEPSMRGAKKSGIEVAQGIADW